MKTRLSDPDLLQALSADGWEQCEQLIQAFEEAWLQDSHPRIRDFLLFESNVRLALLVELVHVDLEFRLKRREPARVENYLEAFPEIRDRASAVVDLLAAERDLRRRFDQPAALEEYVARFPALEDSLSQRFARAAPAATPSRSASPTVAEAPEAPGYQIDAELGRGGMGVVYRAFDPGLQRSVAIKFVPSEYAEDTERFARFVREARTVSALNHPNVCTVHALGEHQGRPYLVMELVEGRTLRAARAAPGEMVAWLAQAARALAAAHAAGVVHRDVKPENIMVRDDGIVKVVDFGLARRRNLSDPNLSRHSDAGALVGTVAYMSPEQTAGAPAEAASDVFSLGVVAYELLAGRHPFDAGTPMATLQAIAQARAPAPTRVNPEIPARLSGLVESMLHHDPRLRPTAAEVEAALAQPADCCSPTVVVPLGIKRPIVRREQELGVLRSALAEADAARGSFVCLAGEPGIGKTTLAEDFLNEVAADATTRIVVRGHCSERLAETEAYLPVLEALEGLLRTDASATLVRLLRVTAPAWFAQIAPGREAAPPGESAAEAGSQSAMVREFCNFIVEATRRATVVLFIDDLHWADLSTVDLLSALGRPCSGLRLLVVLTYRPTELLLHRHPFRNVKQDLTRRDVCTEISLSFLDRQGVARYLDIAFPGNAFPAELAELVHARTEGNPLFMADLLRYLCDRRVLAETDGQWQVAGAMPDLSRELPDSVRGVIERQLDALDAADHQLLTAAAVQGCEFDSLIVADALGRDPAEVEEQLQRLDRTHGLVRLVRQQELPGPLLSLRYAFVHILYQQVLYQDLAPTRRGALSLALARALAARNPAAETAPAVTAELACLYEVGRDYLKAAEYLWLASQHAGRVYAHGESVALALRGIKLLALLPESRQRDELERRLQTMVGLQLQVTQGYAAPAARTAYLRARALVGDQDDVRPVFAIVWGLWLVAKVRSELGDAQRLAEELLALARRSKSFDLELQAHQALGMTAFCRGEPETTLRHVEWAAALYDPVRHFSHASRFGQDPAVTSKAFGAVALWLMGYPDSALRQMDDVLRMQGGRSPTSRAVSLHFASLVHQFRGDPHKALEYADLSGAVSDEHRLSFFSAGSIVMQGWALTAQGRREQGLARLRRGLVAWQSTGSVTYRTYYLGLLAESLGPTPESLAVLREALDVVEQTGERLYEAELHRLWGERLLARADGAAEVDGSAARGRFDESRRIARQQRARALELRTAISLARWEQQHRGAPGAERQELARLYGAFSEGFETADLRAARELLSA